MTQYTRNILKVYKQCTEEEIAHGMDWYFKARSSAKKICDKYELPLHIVVGADVAFILKGPKITDFFWCILGENTCVIDGHAWCIANNDRRKLQEVPNIGKALRQQLQEAYRSAGLKNYLSAHEMQAATWLAWKRIHNV